MFEIILIRGIPGSGKSTLAKNLTNYIHIETDMYWGKDYKFDPAQLGKAHSWCQEKFKFILSLELDFITYYKGIIVSNTFTTLKELRPYFEIAKHFNIMPQIILCQGNYKNVHNVPTETIEKMKNRFQFDVSELYHEFFNE